MGRCEQCAEENPQGARFCLGCGAPMATDGEQAQVRKTVTLLFADVAESTALGERLDPETLRTVMDRYFATVHAVVESHGGTVEKFIGDAVVAAFGLPVVREDDALRAVRAAHALRGALADLNRELGESWGVAVDVCVGVNTGEVIAGAARAGGTFATGDAVNVAARLQQEAGPGEVLLGGATYALVSDVVRGRLLPPLTVKGKAEPVTAHVLDDVVRTAPGRHTTALVGRDREVRLLLDMQERTVASASCHVVNVVGPAGVGKSRLVAEVVAAVRGSAAVVGGACLSYGDGAVWSAVGGIVRGAVGLGDDVAPDAARDLLIELFSDDPDAEFLAARLAAVAGAGGELGSSEETAVALTRLLARLATDGPVVVVVEDLHFAEPAFLEMLGRVVGRVAGRPVLVLCTMRRELWERTPDWGAGRPDQLTLTLQPLASSDVATFAAAVLQGEPAADVVDALQAAEGNPLFVEQILRVLQADGALLRRGDTWEFAGDHRPTEVPASISAILSARLEQLPRDERTVLERAAVVGRSFRRDALAALLPDDLVERVDELCSELLGRELLVTADDGDRDLLSFAHALLRDAAYDRLPKSTRVELHVRLADRLPEQPDAGDPDADARHLRAAAELRRSLGPLDGPGRALVSRAAARMAETARRIAAIDSVAARALVTEAWDLCGTDDPGRLTLLAAVVRVFSHAEELATLDRIVVEAEGQASDDPRDQLLVQLARFARDLHSVDDVDVAAWDDTLVAARDALGGDPSLVSIVELSAVDRATYGDIPSGQMVATIETAAAAAERAGDAELRGQLLGEAATFSHFLDLPLADMLARLREIDAELNGFPRFQAHARGAAALALAEMGRPAEARAAMLESRHLTEISTGSPFDPTFDGFFFADVEALTGDAAAACSILEETVAALECVGERGYSMAQRVMWLWHAAVRVRENVDALVADLLPRLSGPFAEYEPMVLAAANVGAGRPTTVAQAREVVTTWRSLRGEGVYSWLDNALLTAAVLTTAGLVEECQAVVDEAVAVADELGYVARAAELRALVAATVTRG